jgi:hypothetical protein
MTSEIAQEARPDTATSYHAILAGAVAGLASNTTAARRAIYERARATLSAQLRGIDPPLSEAEIMQERLALEAVIGSIENEAVLRAGDGAGSRLLRMDRLGRVTVYAVAALLGCALLVSWQPDLTRWVMIAGLIGWVGLHAWQSRRGATAYVMAGLVLAYVGYDLFQGCSVIDAVEGASTAGLLGVSGFAAGHRDRASTRSAAGPYRRGIL